jgi:hypothetical protein
MHEKPDGLTPDVKRAIDAVSRIAVLEILRDASLWTTLRILWSVRYGELGRALDEKRAGSPVLPESIDG